jgi:hypothetical protein
MAQRLVFLNLPVGALPDEPEAVTFFDLDVEKLTKSHPKLAEQLKGRRIVSHTIHTWGIPQETIVSFVTEPIRGNHPGIN